MMSVRHLIAAAAPRQPSRIHKDPEHGVPILGVAKYVKFAMPPGSAPEWPSRWMAKCRRTNELLHSRRGFLDSTRLCGALWPRKHLAR